MEKIRLSKNWVLPPDSLGLRADVYLQQYMGRISRIKAQRIIQAGDFVIEEKTIKPSTKIIPGKTAKLWRFAPDDPNSIEDFSIDVIYECNDLLVLNKPPGLDVHPNANTLYKSVTYWLKKHFSQKIVLCHRIDRDTSGVLVCAKNPQTDKNIKKQFLAKNIKKTYLAVVKGQMDKSLFINKPLTLCSKSPLRIRMIPANEGKPAFTKIRPIFYSKAKNYSLVMVKPLTGRQHQIRAHLNYAGYPIVGDKLYGQTDEFFKQITAKSPEYLSKLEHFRHALHAYSLTLSWQEKTLQLKAPIPDDFSFLL